MELEQYAEVLGIAAVDAVSEPKVRAAFSRACLELHPLAHGEAARGPALRQFRDAREAFVTLQRMLRKLRAKGKSAQVQEGGASLAPSYSPRRPFGQAWRCGGGSGCDVGRIDAPWIWFSFGVWSSLPLSIGRAATERSASASGFRVQDRCGL
jgi:hypothetical protein